MDQAKNNYSDTSAAESDHSNHPEKPSDDSAASSAGGAARSYDCAFCKRGFTNAQALGGHMNIHRKDKARAKAKTASNKHKSHEDALSKKSVFSHINTADYYSDQGFGSGHVNYQVYMPPPNPGLQIGIYEYCFFPIWRPDHMEDRVDGNFGLRMGVVEDEEKEVDLELRLGRLF